MSSPSFLAHQLVSGLFVFSSTHKKLYLNFPPNPIQEEGQDSTWVDSWQPTEVNPKQ